MLRRLLTPGALLACLLLCGCTVETLAPLTITPAPAASVPLLPPERTRMPAETPAPEPSPSPMPAPTPQTATIGFLGDILIMQTQVQNAKQADGTYDFSGSFAPMEALFAETGAVCVNFEGAMAGAEAGYSEPRPTAPPPTEADPTPKQPYQTFNAPDTLAQALAAAGVDLVSTANNHCLDRGYDGLLRTAETLRAAGLLQSGAYRSEEDRFTPRILAVNGIRIGVVSATESVNRNDALIPSESRGFAVSRLSEEEQLAREIASCREAGAEFIIAFVHWVWNLKRKRTAARKKRRAGSCLRGRMRSWVRTRMSCSRLNGLRRSVAGELMRAPVLYSLGNFVSNMSKPDTEYGMFARLRLLRGADGAVSCTAVEYLPVLCLRQKLADGRTLHQAVPCYADVALSKAAVPLDADAREEIEACYAHVADAVGTDAANLIEWSESDAQ